MLQGLGRQLRNCGVDTVILENGQGQDVALQVCIYIVDMALIFSFLGLFLAGLVSIWVLEEVQAFA